MGRDDEVTPPLAERSAAASEAAPEPRTTVFLSYSRKDMAFADRLEPALEALGIQVLIDRTEIYAFEDWWQRIQALIVGADTVVFVVSRTPSRPTVREGGRVCRGLGKRLAPIVARRAGSAIPEALSRVNFIFFDDHDKFDDNVNRLVEALLTDIAWVRQQTELSRIASAWTSGGLPRGLLLRPPRLEDAEHWLASRPHSAPVPAEAVRDLIATSRRWTTTRLRWILGGSLAAAALATSLAVFAWFQRTEAVTQKAIVSDRLTRLSVATGTRLLDQGDVPGALLWFANPLAIQPADEPVHRIRIAATAGLHPQLLQVMPHEVAIQQLEVDARGETLLTFGTDASIRVWDVRTGALKFPPFKPETKPGAVALAADGKTFAIITPKPHDEAELRELMAQMRDAAAAEDKKKEKPKEKEEEKEEEQISPDDFKALAEMLDPLSQVRLFDAATGAALTSVVQQAGEGPTMWPNPGGGFVISGTVSIPYAGGSSQTVIWRPGQTPAIVGLGNIEFSRAAFSADGGSILAVVYPLAWKLMTSTGTAISSGRHPEALQRSVSAAALSPTGRQLATGDNGGQIVFWDAPSGQPSGKPVQQGSEVSAMEYSPDGRWLAAVSNGDKASIKLWDSMTGQRVFEAPLGAPGFSVSFSPSGRYLLTTSRLPSMLDGEAQIFDAGTGLAVGPKLVAVYEARWTPDGRSVITVGTDQTVKVWEPFRSATILSLGQQELLRHGRFSDTGQVLAARVDRKVQRFDVASFDRRDSTQRLQQQTFNHQFGLSDDGSILIDLRDNQSAAIEPGRAEPLPVFEYKDAKGWVAMFHISAIEVNRDRRTVLIGGGNASGSQENGRVLVWDARTGKPRFAPLAHDLYVNAASFSPDGQVILSASRDGTARLWSATTGAELHRLKHDATINHATFDAAGSRVATASDDGTARIWDATTGAEIGPAIRHEGAVGFVTFSRDGSLLATIARASDGELSVLRLWDAATRQPRGAPMNVGRSLYPDAVAAFSPDGRFIVASSWVSNREKGYRVWSAVTSEAVTPHLDGGDDSERSVHKRFLPRARTLVASQDRNGGLLLLGIGNGGAGDHQVAPWSLPRDDRPAADIVLELELVAGRRIDATGALVRLTAPEIEDRWRRLKAGPHAPAAAGRDRLAEWHRRESEECEALREWFCTAWHIDRLRALDPSLVDASLHRSRGHALAELERWADAEAEYAAARAQGAKDGDTLASLARLRAASKSTGGDPLATALIEEAGRATEWRDKDRLLRAALMGPTTEAERTAIVELTQREITSTQLDYVRTDALNVLALAFYRSNRLADARAQLDELKKRNYLGKASSVLLAIVAWRMDDRVTAAEQWKKAQAAMESYRGIRRYEDGNHASSLYWYEWLDCSLLAAEAAQLMPSPPPDPPRTSASSNGRS
jgi:WD40 repeat protein